MTTKIFSHPDIFLHDHIAQHGAMKSNRIETIYAAVTGVPGAEVVTVNEAPLSTLKLAHTEQYVNRLMDHAPSGYDVYALDMETIMNRHTMRALLLSAGAVITAVDAVHKGEITNAFCPVYAGHHATPDRGMGFCFINNIAIGAKYAASLGFERIAVVDFDTHSGNGTVAALKGDNRFRFVETFQPGFPGPIFRQGESHRNIRRIEVDSRETWLQSWEYLLGDIEQIVPDIILVSAGFDAHEGDPLGIPQVKDEDYAWLTSELMKIQPRIVSALEGGYSLPDTSRCASIHVTELMKNNERDFI